jgi:hypothetical protein
LFSTSKSLYDAAYQVVDVGGAESRPSWKKASLMRRATCHYRGIAKFEPYEH